jgi:phosphonate degradation associated HDIG domain protein
MTTMTTVMPPIRIHPADLVDLFRRLGSRPHDGEGVSQCQHGWQCARLARQAGAPAALQLAAWLHDVGHLMADVADSPAPIGVDDRHEEIAARGLAGLFGQDVIGPIALHVQAKRHLVATRPDYAARLSPDSVRSLALQGGPMTAAESTAFMAHPSARDALRLRAWDDHAKDPSWQPESEADALRDLALLMRRVLGGAQGPRVAQSG